MIKKAKTSAILLALGNKKVMPTKLVKRLIMGKMGFNGSPKSNGSDWIQSHLLLLQTTLIEALVANDNL